MKTILIPIDFSEHSFSTFKYAVMIAGKSIKTKLHIHHSYNDQIATPDPGINSGFDNESFLNIELIDELRNQAIKNMEDFVKKAVKYLEQNKISNLIIDNSVEGGEPDWEILSICDSVSPVLIVMGTQGKGKKEIFEGSVAKKIMNNAKVPVIAVPENMNNINENVNVLYPSNNREKDFMKINLLFTIFRNVSIKIHVVHFHLKGTKDINIDIIEELQQAFKDEANKKLITFSLIDTSDKNEVISSFVAANNINTIAFIAHKKNLFQNIFGHKITKDDFISLGLPMVAMHE